MIRKVLLFLSLAAMLISTGCGVIVVGDWNIANYTGTWQDEIEFSGSRIRLEGSNGSITVVAWDKDIVDVEVRWNARVDNYDFQPVIDKDGDSLSISYDRSDRDITGVRYVVSVPKGLDLVLVTSNGRIDVSGEALNSIKASTSNGQVLVDNAGEGKLDINTSNGVIRVNDWLGEIDASTSNGAITAVLGKIEHPVNFRTSNGGISFTVDAGSEFEITASTSNGGIRNSLPGTLNLSEMTGRHIEGTYNGGGMPVTLRTSNSNIQILPR